jgi:phosphoesterase RecJ-like protein
MADYLRQASLRRVVVDHHAGETEIPGLVLRDATCEAAGRLIYDLIRFLDVPLSRDMACALFTAIATDTGWFRFPSTTSSTYRVVGELVAAGAQPHDVFCQLYERDTLSRARLRGIMLSRVVLELQGRLAHTYLAAEDFTITGALPSETEDFVNMALAIDGTEVAVIMTEQVAGTVKVSLRSRGGVDCSALAAALGGGGHKAASGATLRGPLEQVRTRVLQAVRQALLDAD